MALTDHDTISGIDDAISQSTKIGIKFIPGIELSTLYKGRSVHVLGYFKNIDNIDNNFRTFLKKMNDYRVNRAREIVENLYKFFNIKLDYDDIIKKTQME